VTRVVLVDDHPLFVEALRAAVERAGLEVAGTASRGDELMNLMETVEADAVLLDLAMPGLDGYECLDQLRERHPNTRVIVVSATDDQENIRRALTKTTCIRGHDLTDPTNVACRPGTERRYCKACNRERQRDLVRRRSAHV